MILKHAHKKTPELIVWEADEACTDCNLMSPHNTAHSYLLGRAEEGRLERETKLHVSQLFK